MDPYRPNPSPHGYYGAAEGAHAAPAPSEQPTARHVCLSKSLACSRINPCASCDAYVENYAFTFAITAARLTVEQATLFYNAYKEAMIQLHVHMTRDPQISAGALDLRRVQILPEQFAYPVQPAAHAPPPYQPVPSPLAPQPQAAWQPPWPPPPAMAPLPPPPAMTAPPPPPPSLSPFQPPSAGQLPQYGEHVASPFGSAPVGPPAASTARTYGGRAAPAAAGTPAAPQRAVPVVNLRPEIAAMVAARGMQNPLPPYADDGDDEGDEEDDYDDDAAADDGPSYETPEPPESDIPPFDYQPVDDASVETAPVEAAPVAAASAAPPVVAAPPAAQPPAPMPSAARSQRSGNVALAPLPKGEELTVADVAGAGTTLAVTTSGPRDVADEPPLNGTTRSPTG